jgi:hypothetical protein
LKASTAFVTSLSNSTDTKSSKAYSSGVIVYDFLADFLDLAWNLILSYFSGLTSVLA